MRDESLVISLKCCLANARAQRRANLLDTQDPHAVRVRCSALLGGQESIPWANTHVELRKERLEVTGILAPINGLTGG